MSDHEDQAHSTKGFSIAEPDVDDHGCAFCPSMEVHSVMEMVDHIGTGKWVSVPICLSCQKVITITLARDLATNEGYADTPDELAKFMSLLAWSSRDPVEGEDSPPLVESKGRVSVERSIGNGSQVKHIKSSGRNHWYKKLNRGVVEHISESGKSAEVRWFDQNGQYLHWGTYKLDNLILA